MGDGLGYVVFDLCRMGRISRAPLSLEVLCRGCSAVEYLGEAIGSPKGLVETAVW